MYEKLITVTHFSFSDPLHLLLPVDSKLGYLWLINPLHNYRFDNPFAHLPVVSSPLRRAAVAENLTARAVPASCADTITPSCLQALYGIPTTLATESSNMLGVSRFINQFAQTADLRSFLEANRPDLPASTTFTTQTLDGGLNPQGFIFAGTEADLDIQYTVGVASGVPTTFISVGELNKDGALGGFLDIINFLLGESNPPQVLTTSYGQNEDTISSNLAK